MNSNFSPTRRQHTVALAATFLVSTAAAWAAAAPTDAFPTYESYIKVSGQTPFVSGNKAAAEKRTQQRADGATGIEDLHVAKDVARNTTLVVDGRALFGAEDYLLRFNLSKQNVGSIDAGYSRFRTFYDGIGGFFPLNRQWLPLSPEQLHTDRGRFWAEVKFAFKDKPVFTLRYTNETRSGTKDSLIWGDSNLTGLPTLPANNATRKIAPALLQLDERHEALEGGLRQVVGQTTVDVKLIGDWVDNDDRRTFVRYPKEVTPNPERVNAQRDAIRTNSFSLLATTETAFSERVSFSTGWSYQHLSSIVAGERANAIGVLPTYDFKDLAGGSKVDVYTANTALALKPSKDWLTQVALRYEDNYTKSAGNFTRVTQTNATAPQVLAFYKQNERTKEKIVTPDLSARYVGFKKIVLYATFSDRLNRGDERRTDQFATVNPTLAQIWSQDLRQDQAHSTFGTNWNASSALILRGEVFHKEHENKFLGYDTKLGSRYVIGYQFTGLKLTAIVKPIPQLSLTTRYLPQNGNMQVTTESTAKFDSMKARTHLIGETIDWNPNARVFLQANLNLGFNYISSAYPSSANPNQRNADNNYASGSLITGWVAGKHTDLNVQYTWQKADNFLPSLATYSQPYGASYKEETIAVGVKHRLSPQWLATGKVGYFDSKNDTTGGRTNFRGPLAYIAVEHEL